jgi:hypothetical protein
LAERRQRPVGVGAAHGKTKRPGIDIRRIRKFIADQIEKWGKVVKFAGVKAD